MKFFCTALAHPRWFLAVWRVGIDSVMGLHNVESFENELKLAATKYDVDYHRFGG